MKYRLTKRAGAVSVTSGTCTTNGRTSISSKAACEGAAKALGWSHTTATEETTSSWPKGCYKSSGGNLYFNSASSGTACQPTKVCACGSAGAYTKATHARTAPHSIRCMVEDAATHCMRYALCVAGSFPQQRLVCAADPMAMDAHMTSCASLSASVPSRSFMIVFILATDAGFLQR